MAKSVQWWRLGRSADWAIQLRIGIAQVIWLSWLIGQGLRITAHLVLGFLFSRPPPNLGIWGTTAKLPAVSQPPQRLSHR
jgi:hypothetical protein